MRSIIHKPKKPLLMHYVVRHPNFDEYLKVFDKPITTFHSPNDSSIVEETKKHEWVAIGEATRFDTAAEASNKFTSLLCSTVFVS